MQWLFSTDMPSAHVGKGEEPCISNKDTADCSLCNAFTPEQRAQISTPSYKIKEKREAKHLDST